MNTRLPKMENIMLENLIPLEPSCLSTNCTNLDELIEYGTDAQCRAALADIVQQLGTEYTSVDDLAYALEDMTADKDMFEADVETLKDDLAIEVSRADTFESLASTMAELLREIVVVDGPDTATSKAIADVLAKYDAE